MFGLGAGELLIILAFALIFIGPKKLPELAKGLGKSIREFQKAKDDLMAQVHEESNNLKQDIMEDRSEEAIVSSHDTPMELQDSPEENFEEFDKVEEEVAHNVTPVQEDHHSALTEDHAESIEASADLVKEDSKKKV